MTTSVTGAQKYFPKPQEGFTTTTSGSISSGATSVGLTSTGNYSNGDIVVFIIEPGVSGKEQSFTGTIDTAGVQVTGVVWVSGTNSAHSGGVTVVDYIAAAHLHLISTGILIAHDQAGTHKSGATYPLPVIADYTNATHTHQNTATGGTLGAAALPALNLSTQTLSNPYKFLAYITTTVNLTSSYQIMPFDSKTFDTNNNFNTSTHRYTAPVAGFYQFHAQGHIQTLADQAYALIYILKNGVAIAQGSGFSSGANDNAPQVNVMIQLSANDYVEVYVTNSQGTRNWLGTVASGVQYLTYFQGYLISTT